VCFEAIQYDALRSSGQSVDLRREAEQTKLARLMDAVHKVKVDVVAVWRFDRFARSASHLLRALESFQSAGVDFVSYSESIDTLQLRQNGLHYPWRCRRTGALVDLRTGCGWPAGGEGKWCKVPATAHQCALTKSLSCGSVECRSPQSGKSWALRRRRR
jgi:Resolvase, N terminal domain